MKLWSTERSSRWRLVPHKRKYLINRHEPYQRAIHHTSKCIVVTYRARTAGTNIAMTSYERQGVWNHRHLGCLFNKSYRLTWKERSNVRITVSMREIHWCTKDSNTKSVAVYLEPRYTWLIVLAAVLSHLYNFKNVIIWLNNLNSVFGTTKHIIDDVGSDSFKSPTQLKRYKTRSMAYEVILIDIKWLFERKINGKVCVVTHRDIANTITHGVMCRNIEYVTTNFRVVVKFGLFR